MTTSSTLETTAIGLTSTTTPTAMTTTGSNLINTSNSQVMFDILQNYDGDLTSCLLNCSNNGVCFLDKSDKKFKCSCDAYFTGYSCQTDIRPCSSNPCINNSTCINYQKSSGIWHFSCNCSSFYTGIYCENKINICENETCSSNGNCYDNSSVPACKCFQLYEGVKCDKKSEKLIMLKGVIKSASIIAIITIVVFFIFILILDISGCVMDKKLIRTIKKSKKS